MLEPVSAAGDYYEVPKELARAFARAMGIKDDQNFPRAINPAVTSWHFVEHWQGLYNLRWLEKVDMEDRAFEWALVWGQPRHSMKDFFLSVKRRWPELPSWDYFRQAIADNSKKKIKGFRMTRLPPEQSRRRLTKKELPAELKVWLAQRHSLQQFNSSRSCR